MKGKMTDKKKQERAIRDSNNGRRGRRDSDPDATPLYLMRTFTEIGIHL